MLLLNLNPKYRIKLIKRSRVRAVYVLAEATVSLRLFAKDFRKSDPASLKADLIEKYADTVEEAVHFLRPLKGICCTSSGGYSHQGRDLRTLNNIVWALRAAAVAIEPREAIIADTLADVADEIHRKFKS